MRFHRIVYMSGWAAVMLLAVAGVAAFSTNVETKDALSPVWGKAVGAVAAQTWTALHPITAPLVASYEEEPVTAVPTETTVAASGPSVSARSEGWLSSVDVRLMVARYFEPEDVNRAVRSAWCASRFDPTWINPSEQGSGLFQLSDHDWSEQAALAGRPGASIFDAEASTAVAAWVVYHGGGWEALTCDG
jgi:hypothetical protein